MVKLYDTLKASYGDKDAERKLQEKGFIKDSSLSNHNQQVYANPKTKKLIFSVAGTHNASDWLTDGYLAVGKLKDTKRYKEADKKYKQAKDKYSDYNFKTAGHSLGSAIAQGIAKPEDHVTTLNGGYTVGQKTRSHGGNFKSYRTQGDVVSLLGANSKNMKTIKNSGTSLIKNLVTSIKNKDPIGFVSNVLGSHQLENIKTSKLKV